MKEIEYIKQDEHLLAIIISSRFEKDGIEFFTPNELSQQLAYMKRPKGYVIPTHIHNPVRREVIYSKETLFIKSGRVRVELTLDDGTPVTSRVLSAGDVILLASGGHGFEMLEETEIIEVKQGPYIGPEDKTALGKRPGAKSGGLE